MEFDKDDNIFTSILYFATVYIYTVAKYKIDMYVYIYIFLVIFNKINLSIYYLYFS